MLLSDLSWEELWPEHQHALRPNIPLKEATFVGKHEFRWIMEQMKDGTYRIRRPGNWGATDWEDLDAVAAQCVLYALVGS
ncbi:MAG: hypothetical protein ACXWQR_14190 [Ktedonobacterales bacterium]